MRCDGKAGCAGYGGGVDTRRRDPWRLRGQLVVLAMAFTVAAVLVADSRGPFAGGGAPGAGAPGAGAAGAGSEVDPGAPALPAGASTMTTPPVTTAPPATTSPASATAPPEGDGEPIRLAFAGDVHFEGELATALAADPAGMLAPIAPVLSSADLAVVNVETAITTGGTPSAKQYNFRAPPSALEALRSAGVDVASLANNHGLDYGVEGLSDSLAAAEEAGLPLIGIGRDEAEAYAPHVATLGVRTVAVIGATQVLDGSLIASWTAGPDQPGLASAKRVDRLVEEVRATRAVADTVVVYLHWGVEKATCPSEDQQQLARTLVDAGADIVVGGHAHRLQGAGRLDGALVAYGLGNFVFYARGGPASDSGVLIVTVDGRDVLGHEWIPAVIQGGIPRPLDGPDAQRAVAAFDDLRSCTGLDP